MHKDVADAWVAALRSGQYRQTTLQLRDVDGFCCLGVLCDLHSKQTGAGEWSSDGYYNTGEETDGVIPTPEVADWAGMYDRSPSLRPEGGGSALITALNDDDGYDFEQIANLIEEQWEEL